VGKKNMGKTGAESETKNTGECRRRTKSQGYKPGKIGTVYSAHICPLQKKKGGQGKQNEGPIYQSERLGKKARGKFQADQEKAHKWKGERQKKQENKKEEKRPSKDKNTRGVNES